MGGESLGPFRESDVLLPQLDKIGVKVQLGASAIRLCPLLTKMYMPDVMLEDYRKPPQSPSDCILARITLSINTDLEGRIIPCQFGGDPDCSHCGCVASAGLNAIGDYQPCGLLPVKSICFASIA